VKYVLDPATGRIVINAMIAMLDAVETVLFIPEERDGAMELLLTLEPIEQHSHGEALADRWRIYHGEPEDMHWAVGVIDAVRHEGFVIDGEALMQPNALADHEARLCKLLNEAGSSRLSAMAFARADRKVESPVAVGVDELGVDLRAAFEVVRLPAPVQKPFASADEARQVLAAWMQEAGAA